MANHREDHPEEVPDCFGCKILTISVNTANLKAARN